MSGLFVSLFGWMPPLLVLICTGVVAIFFVTALLHLIAFVLDLIPFL